LRGVLISWLDPNDGSSKVVISANYMRNPNSKNRDRGINMWAGHARQRLFLATRDVPG